MTLRENILRNGQKKNEFLSGTFLSYLEEAYFVGIAQSRPSICEENVVEETHLY